MALLQRRGASLLVDSTTVAEVDAACEIEILRGRIAPAQPGCLRVDTPLHRMFRVIGKR
jgi:hypothetical protein